MSDAIYTLHRGHRPLLLSLPHVGSVLPEALQGNTDGAALASVGGKSEKEDGCPVRIRTSIDGIRIRSLTIRRRGNEAGAI